MTLQTIADLQDPQHHVQPRVKATRSERKKVLKRAGWGLALIGMLLAWMLWGFFSGSGDFLMDVENFAVAAKPWVCIHS